MIYTIRMIRKSSNFLPVIAGIALMTITACASANLGDFSKATQDAAIAAAVATAQAEATTAATKAAADAATAATQAADDAAAAQKRAVATARATAKAEFECTTPVCDNVVNTADLPRFPTTVTSNSSTFLTITGTEISIAGVEKSSGVDVLASDINGSTRAGDNMDGFRYFSGQFGGTGSTGYFAGILPTTNLGAPLSTPPTTTAWPGTYSQGAGGATNITFNIDFANKRITALDAPGGSLAVRFNLGFSDSGVISGVVLGHVGLTGGENISSFAIATGLIGTEGLVGIFIEDDSYPSSGYVGGFVANNPDTN